MTFGERLQQHLAELNVVVADAIFERDTFLAAWEARDYQRLYAAGFLNQADLIEIELMIAPDA